VASDTELLDAWQAGDRSAGDALLRRYFDPLHRFFANKVSDGVEDLIQSTLLACLEKAGQFRREASFRTYLFVVARNQLYDVLRKRQRQPEATDFSVTSVHDLGTSPSEAVGRGERHALLAVALKSIALDHQVAIELYYWEQLKGPELAEVLGIPANTVRSRLTRARKARQLRLRELGLVGETDALLHQGRQSS